MFEHVIAALVHRSGYQRLASPGCSDRTIRRRLRQWAEAGLAQELLRIGLEADERMIGLNLGDLSVDGAITKSPCGGEVSGRSPVDRGKQGTERSLAADGDGIPLHLVAARANDHDSPLLEPTLAGICDVIGPLPDAPCLHLDRGYDSVKTRDLLEILGYDADIAVKGLPAPVQAGKRWPVQRSTPGSTATANSAAAPTSGRSSLSSTSTSPPRSARSAASSTKRAPSTAGPPDPPPDASAEIIVPVALSRVGSPQMLQPFGTTTGRRQAYDG